MNYFDKDHIEYSNIMKRIDELSETLSDIAKESYQIRLARLKLWEANGQWKALEKYIFEHSKKTSRIQWDMSNEERDIATNRGNTGVISITSGKSDISIQYRKLNP